MKRTLQGNIATYVCGSEGIVYDVLPGIYAPDVYRQQLEELKTLADSLQPKRGAAVDPPTLLRAYHVKQAKRLEVAPSAPAPAQAAAKIGGGFKGGGFGGGFGGGGMQFSGGGFAGLPATGAPGFSGFGGGLGGGAIGMPGGIEGPTERVIAGLPPAPGRAASPPGPLAARPELKVDSEANQRVRRKAVHDELARRGLVHPNDIKKWLYKDVLHADLDDPQLGLGPVLNANYPFAAEDRVLERKK